MKKLSSLEETQDFIFSLVGNDLRLATPLGLGKPNQLLNKIYSSAKQRSDLKLKIFTALSLQVPKAKDDLQGRFLKPFLDRIYGKDYPDLEYLKDIFTGQTPQNVQIHEFYFQAGQFLHCELPQRNYISVNYTHAGRVVHDMGINVIVQLIAASPDGRRYSLSCNPDMTLDIADLYKKSETPLYVIGVIHPEMPYLGGDAEVDEDFFAAILKTPEVSHKLFSIPRTEVDLADHLIGFHASQLLADDGTIQIGIGSLSEALVHFTLIRHRENSLYKRLVDKFKENSNAAQGLALHSAPFDKGLYATSEMLMDGFMHLRQGGVLKRYIHDHYEEARRYMHGAFYLGSPVFYDWLRNLSGDDYDGLSMTRVSKVNDLYDSHEMALRRQRKNARFFNTCMNATLLGGAASETLNDGRVVSGVGGQYNFVAMAHELDDAHSVLMLRSVRKKGFRRVSNIIWSQGHLTIPRHLRDVVITEYGIASLRGQSDEEVIKRLICIADAEFQISLADEAKKNGKLDPKWQVPEWARGNTPEKLNQFAASFSKEDVFNSFPFGNDFTSLENRILKALMGLKKQSKMKTFIQLFLPSPNPQVFREELQRLNLDQPQKLKEYVYRHLVLMALKNS